MKCLTWWKLRGKVEEQKKCQLYKWNASVWSPPFTYVGLDVFGLWMVVAQQTRGGATEAKHWAILFMCMSTRAIHIKVVERMDMSSCINVLRRLFSVHGPAKQLFSDHGTNLLTAYQELGMGTVPKEDPVVQRYQT